MKDLNHKKEWEEIKKRYEKSPESKEEYIRFRIECIDELLFQEQEKELNHFK